MKSKDKSGAARPDGITEMVVLALRRIIRAIDLRSRYLVMRYGLTGPQLTLLKQLSANGGCCVSELTKAIHLSQATATGILDRLEKRRLVRRERSDQDKRRVLVWLTQAGEGLLADAPPLLQEEFTAEFSKLEDWEQAQILSSLQRVVSMMEAKGIEATPILATGPITATSDGTKAFLGEEPQGAEASARPSETVGSKGSARAQGSAPRVIHQGKNAP